MRNIGPILAWCFLFVSQSQAAIIHQYRLDGTYADDFGGPALVSGGGTLDGTKYNFLANQGLTLSDALGNPGVYTIELEFELDRIDGYRKIIDFKDRTVDSGVYAFDGLRFYVSGVGPTTGLVPNSTHLVPNDDTLLVLTRNSSGQVSAYLDGLLQLSFNDINSYAVFSSPNNIMNFFYDDRLQGTEASAGSLNYLRIYDQALTQSEISQLQPLAPISAVPEPATIILWTGLGAVGLMVSRRKRLP